MAEKADKGGRVMEAMVFPFIVFSIWAISRLGDIRDELGRIRRLMEAECEE